MADFQRALSKLLENEGGWADDPSDGGGETYKGISTKYFSKWDGWEIIQRMKNENDFPENLQENIELSKDVELFYKINFWNKLKADKIEKHNIAESIFDFAVNTGVRTSVILAQRVLGVAHDGVIGQKTLAKLNSIPEINFINSFALQKINRYLAICKKNKKNRKFFFGWINRSLRDLVL